MRPGPLRTRLAMADAIVWPAAIIAWIWTSPPSGNMGATLSALVFWWGLVKFNRAAGREAYPREYRFTTWRVAQVLMVVGVYWYGLYVVGR